MLMIIKGTRLTVLLLQISERYSFITYIYILYALHFYLIVFQLQSFHFLVFKPDSSSLGLTLFHSSDWRTDGPVQVSPLLRMIADIERKRGGSDKPVIIMCE